MAPSGILLLLAATSPTRADFVISDDLIVQGSTCVGLDCVDGEIFGFSTLKLKENNTRLRFQDTSTSVGFPANSWELVANDSANGGRNFFAIDDVTGGFRPFAVYAGAKTNSLVVGANSKVGIGTDTPTLDLSISSSDTPAIRLEQTNAGGFTAQTWDIGANEANFFVRDLTGGNKLPFRIRPGAPTSSIDIAASGFVGFGTSSPLYRIDVLEGGPGGASAIHFGGVNNNSRDNGGFLTSTKASNANLSGGASWNGANWIAKSDTASQFEALNGNLSFFTNGGLTVGTTFTPTERLTITSSGNVGIGTITPTAQFHTTGTVRLEGLSGCGGGIGSDAMGFLSCLAGGVTPLVQQAGPGQPITVGAATDGTQVTVSGTAGDRKISGVQNGTVATGSSDAVNGGQLFTVNQDVATNAANLNKLGITTAGAIGGGASYTPATGITGLNYQLNGSGTAFGNVVAGQQALANGAAGPLQYSTPGTPSNALNLVGVGGAVKLGNVAAGAIASGSIDAVNGGQLFTANQRVAAAFGGGAGLDSQGQLRSPSYTIQGTAYNNVGGAFSAVDARLTIDGANIATNTANIATNTAGIAALNGQVTTINNSGTKYYQSNSTGPGASATGANALAMGSSAAAGGANAIAAGTGAQATQAGSIAIGMNSASTGTNAIAIGTNASATGSVAVGFGASAANGGAAFGDGAVAIAVNSTAVGPGAVATHANAVAVGSGSTTSAANTVSVGSAGNERRITNVAAGISPTDAATVGQISGMASGFQAQVNGLQGQISSNLSEARRGIAATAALANVATPSGPGKTTLAVNGSAYEGQTGIGVAIAHRLKWAPIPVYVSAAYGNGGGTQHVGRVGAAVEW